MAITSATVIDFIASAEGYDLDVVETALRNRRKALRAHQALKVQAAATPGTTVRLDGLSPKYLNGMTGVVHATNDKNCSVKLDEQSTDTLRAKSKRFYVPRATKEYVLGGIPFTTVHVD